MNARVKLGIFWGVVAASVLVVFNLFRHLLGGGFHRHFNGGGQGGFRSGGMMGQSGGFRHHAFMYGPHYGGGFHLFGLLLLLIILFFVVRWLRKKAKTTSSKRFIETSIVDSPAPVVSQNGQILDQWEKNLTDKKEIE